MKEVVKPLRFLQKLQFIGLAGVVTEGLVLSAFRPAGYDRALQVGIGFLHEGKLRVAEMMFFVEDGGELEPDHMDPTFLSWGENENCTAKAKAAVQQLLGKGVTLA